MWFTRVSSLISREGIESLFIAKSKLPASKSIGDAVNFYLMDWERLA